MRGGGPGALRVEGWLPAGMMDAGSSCSSLSEEEEEGEGEGEGQGEGEAGAWDRAALLASFTTPRWVSTSEAIDRRNNQLDATSEEDTEDEEERLGDAGDEDEDDFSMYDSGSATSSTSWTALSDRQEDAHDGCVDSASLIARMDRAAHREDAVPNEWVRTEDILKSIEWVDRAPWHNEVLPEEAHAFGRGPRRRAGGRRRDSRRLSQLSGGSTAASSNVSRSLSMYDFEHLSQCDIAGMADDVKIATVQEHMMRQDARDAAKASEILSEYVEKRCSQTALAARQRARARAEELSRQRLGRLEARNEAKDMVVSDATVVDQPMTPPLEAHFQRVVPKLHETVEQRPILAPTGCLRACLRRCTCRDVLPLSQTSTAVQGDRPTSLSDTGNRLRSPAQKVAEHSQPQWHSEKPIGLESDTAQAVEKQQRDLMQTRTALLDRLAKAREIVRADEMAGGADKQQSWLTGFSKGVAPLKTPVPTVAARLRSRSAGDIDIATSESANTAQAVAASSENTRISTTNFRLPPAQGIPRPPPRSERGSSVSSSECHQKCVYSSAAADSVTNSGGTTERLLSLSADEIATKKLVEGNEALALGRHDAAIQVFEQALQICPGHASLASRLAHAKGVKREVNRVVGTWLRAPGASGVGSKRPNPSAIHSLKVAERCATPISRTGCRPKRVLAFPSQIVRK